MEPQLQGVLSPIQQASPLERAYYFRFLQFVANEQVLSKIGNRNKENAGFAATWNSSLEDKRQAGNIYENLTLHPDEEGDRVENITFYFSQEHAGGDADLSNFRVGDIVFFYPYLAGTLPDATATMVFRCTITDIQTNTVRVRLRNAQTSRTVFAHFSQHVWAMEHDFMDSSYNAQYRGLHAFLSAPKERRDLLLGQRPPTVDTHITHLEGDYGSEEFNNLVLHARQARDLYLVIGPPGTGKTSYGMKNILTEELLQPHTHVLLLSYTNRAVDEICSKLVDIPDLDFIRLGSDFSCEARYRPYLLSERISQMEQPNVQRVRNLIAQTRVFCGTTTALSSSLSPGSKCHKAFRVDWRRTSVARSCAARHRRVSCYRCKPASHRASRLPSFVLRAHAPSLWLPCRRKLPRRGLPPSNPSRTHAPRHRTISERGIL